MRNRFIFGIIIILCLAVPIQALAAEAYIVGPDDVLDVHFWQDESDRLNAEVKVRQDGLITLDIIGEIMAAGLTTAELEKNIIRQISRFDKLISQVAVRITQYGFQKVYISGQVQTPGKYTFEKIPNLWTLINEAGGVTEFGDLSRVLLIRSGIDSGKVEIINVAEAVASGTLASLPAVLTGDALEVSRMPGGLPARTLSVPSEVRNIFYVSGEVNTPGGITLEENIDILTAIAMAGGPTENANMKKVKIISQDGYNAQIATINLAKYSQTGTPGRYIVQPADNIIVERKRAGFLGFNSITEVATLITSFATIYLLYDQISQRDETTH